MQFLIEFWGHSIYTFFKNWNHSIYVLIKMSSSHSIYAISYQKCLGPIDLCNFCHQIWGHSIYAIVVTNGKKLPFFFLKNLSNRCLNFHSKGGNAAQFLQTFVRPKLKSMLTSFKQRQMLPIFPRESSSKSISLVFRLKRGNAAHFSPHFYPDQCLRFSGSKQEEMLPIFAQDFSIQMMSCFFGCKARGNAVEFAPRIASFHIDVVICSGSEQGGNAAFFSPRFFWGFKFETREDAAHFLLSLLTCFGFQTRENAAHLSKNIASKFTTG